MNDYMIETRNLTKKYGSQVSVSNLNIHVRKGRIYGLLGRNGAGKTTTMRMLLGLTAPTSGNVKIFGKPFQENEKKILPRIGCLIESPGFYPNLTGTENLKIFAELRGLRNPNYVKGALELVNLPYRDKKLFSQYSLGMKQRLAIALAVMHDPELLILDEPINGLDPIGIAEVRSFIRELCDARGKTILISSHILSEISLLADDVGIIDHGKLLEEESLKELEAKNAKFIHFCVSDAQKAAQIIAATFQSRNTQLADANNLYLYDKPSPENKHKMIIDEPAAEIVREIFDAVIAGKTTSEIAANLNARDIPTPQEHKGVRRKENTEPQWTHPRIVYMIRNIKYTGVMTNHTRESRFIRDKNQRRVPMSEWIIHPDAHEAIIPREKWEQANEMLRKPKKVTKAVLDQPDRVYYCAHCGRKLRKTYGSDQYYSCASAKYQHDSECSGIRLKRSEMEEILVEALRAQINFVKQTQQTVKKREPSPSMELYRTITQAEKELTQLQSKKMERYEAYRSGEISREDFIKVKDQITSQVEALTAKKEQLEKDYQAQLQAKQRKAETKGDVAQAEKVLADFDAGLREHLYEAIDRVIVTSNEQIEIKWVFADVFAQKGEIC